MSLTLQIARLLVDAALTEARARDAKPLAVVVLDAGGHPVAFAREDGATLFRFEIARAKASGAVGMGDDTRVLAARAAGNPNFFNSLAVAVGGQLALSPGGVVLRDASGALIGAIGVSGDTGDVDEACALVAIGAAGLQHGNVA